MNIPEQFFNPDKETSLYVHVPFCHAKCDYCAFYSIPARQWGDLRKRYVHRIVQEIQACADALQRPFDTVFFGGGNPGSLEVEDLSMMLKAACTYGKPRECTLEMNPESLDERFDPLFQTYVDRLSMGVQSLDADTLRTLGRNIPFELVKRGIAHAVRLAELYDTRLSFDLMTCIQGQSAQAACLDIQQLVALADPEHLSLYCLSLEEGTPILGRVGELSEEQQVATLRSCWACLSDLGYTHYEVSNFCRDGAKSLHNCNYWRLNQYVGLGPGAAGTALLGDSLVGWRCPDDVQAFCSGEPLSGYEQENLGKREELEEYLLVSLRMSEGINKKKFVERFGFSFDALMTDRIRSIIEAEYYIDTEERFSITEAGWMMLDDIVLQLAYEVDRIGVNLLPSP